MYVNTFCYVTKKYFYRALRKTINFNFGSMHLHCGNIMVITCKQSRRCMPISPPPPMPNNIIDDAQTCGYALACRRTVQAHPPCRFVMILNDMHKRGEHMMCTRRVDGDRWLVDSRRHREACIPKVIIFLVNVAESAAVFADFRLEPSVVIVVVETSTFATICWSKI